MLCPLLAAVRHQRAQTTFLYTRTFNKKMLVGNVHTAYMRAVFSAFALRWQTPLTSPLTRLPNTPKRSASCYAPHNGKDNKGYPTPLTRALTCDRIRPSPQKNNALDSRPRLLKVPRRAGGAIIGTHAPAGIFADSFAVHAWKGGAYHFDAANRSGNPRTFFYMDWVSAAFTDVAVDAPPYL